MLWLQLQQLKSRNAQTRVQAVKGLAESRSPWAFKALTKAAQDVDGQVRVAAVTALGKMESDKVLPTLLGALKDTFPEVRRAAVDVLRFRNEPGIQSALVVALKDFDAGVRGRAARGLAQSGWRPSNEQEQIALAVAQGKLAKAAAHGPAAIGALEMVLNGGPYNLQVNAVEALGSIVDERVFRLLVPALKSSDHAVCVAAVTALSNMGGPKVINSLSPLLRHADHRVRVAAIEALAQLDAQQVAGPLLQLLRDSMWDVRCAAASALGKVRDPEAVNGLISAIEDPDTDVRHAVISSLGNLRDSRAIGPLVLALKDSESVIRRAAASALDLIDPRWAQSEEARSVVHELRAATGSNDQAVQYAATNVLAQLGETGRPTTTTFGDTALLTVADKRRGRAVTVFVELLRDSDNDLRLAAAESLGRLGDRQAASALMTSLSDPHLPVRRAATLSLQQLGLG